MPNENSQHETLDLRFRVVPKRANRGLPGGALVWFALGIAVGGAIWLIGRRELANRLAKQVHSETTSTSLMAMEALSTLEPNRIDYLVSSLNHADSRVAKAAHQMLVAQIEKWNMLDIVEHYALLRTLADQLQQISRTTPPANMSLVQSLAAKLYSRTISIDDPQIKPVTVICQRLLTLESQVNTDSKRVDSAALSMASQTKPNTQISGQQLPKQQLPSQPPNPLPPIASSTSANDGESAQSVNQSIHRSSGNPTASLHLVTGATKPRSTIVKPVPNESESNVIQTQNRVPTNGGSGFALSDSDDRPVVVSTPASVSSTTARSMKVVSTAATDLSNLDKLEIAELVKLLAHENPDIAKTVALTLSRKGMSDAKIQLASELATGTASRRLQLVQQVATAGDVDPRPWLVWMSEDGEPEVRRMAISLLVPMADESVVRSLRNLAARENDDQIRQTIERALAASTGR